MARDQETGQFEWVNAWASASGATTDAVTAESEPETAPTLAPAVAARFVVGKPQPGLAPFGAAPPPDQLMRDIAEIERARDALAAGAIGRRMRTFMVVPRRTADSVPLLIGGVLALVMLSVFIAGAAMTKIGR